MPEDYGIMPKYVIFCLLYIIKYILYYICSFIIYYETPLYDFVGIMPEDVGIMPEFDENFSHPKIVVVVVE